MVYGYVRVSSNSQQRYGYSLNQQAEMILTKFPEATIIQEVHTATTIRPIFIELLSRLNKGDILVCATIDRLTRNTREGIELYDLMTEKSFSIHIMNWGTLEHNGYSRYTFINSVALAEYEHSQISLRTKQGLTAAKLKKKDFKNGRPPKYDYETMKSALELLQTNSYNQVVFLTGISKSTLLRMKHRLDKKEGE